MSIDSSGTLIENSFHGLLVSVLLSQGHLACIDTFIHLRFGNPNPPTHFRAHIASHAIAQLPPFASALRHHRKPLHTLFIVAIVLMGRSKAIIAWIGMAHKMDWTKVSLPLFGIREAFHLGKRFTI